MDLISAYSAINKSTIGVVDSINSIKIVEKEKSVPQMRLRENTFVMTENIKRSLGAITAHNIEQYKNKFTTIKLEEEAYSWLLELLKIDEGDNGQYAVARSY